MIFQITDKSKSFPKQAASYDGNAYRAKFVAELHIMAFVYTSTLSCLIPSTIITELWKLPAVSIAPSYFRGMVLSRVVQELAIAR